MNISSNKQRAMYFTTVSLLAVAILFFSVPRLMAALHHLPGDKVYRLIQDRRPINPRQLKQLVDSRQKGLEWQESPRAWTDLALAWLMLGSQTAGAASPDKGMVDQSIEVLKRGLVGGPANSNAWVRLALAFHIKGGAPDRTVPALTMSLLTGPYRKSITMVRLDLALRAWRYFPPADRPLVLMQVRYALKQWPRYLSEFANTPRRIGFVRSALASKPRELALFETYYQRFGRKR